MPPDIAFRPHDHHRCRAALLAHARRIAEAEGLRLTPVRRRVLEILAEAHRPCRAYEVLDRLADEGHRRQPPIAYRALDFLCAHGLAHRIECLNAFAACQSPGTAHVPSFLICRGCGQVAETAAPALQAGIAALAEASTFAPDPVGVEITGLCPHCAPATAGADA